MFDQYLELGGTEIANAARVAAYVDKNAPYIPISSRARDRLGNSDIAQAVGDAPYESPTVDGAPWFDPTEPSTSKFYGVWPLAVQGITDSTLQATAIEAVGTGGSVGAQRFASRAIRVRALLVAENDEALESGQSWLEAALKSNTCGDHGDSCGGASLCYFIAEPEICRLNDPTYQAGFTMPISATPQTSPLIIRETADESIWSANLLAESTGERDGTIVGWGAVSNQDTTQLIEQYGPVVLQRTNYIQTPTFDEGLGIWAGPNVEVVPVGGRDGGPFARIWVPVDADNFIADPSLETYEPAALGWTSHFDDSNGITHDFTAQAARVEDLTAPDGTHVASIAADADGVPDSSVGATIYGSVTIPILPRPLTDASTESAWMGASLRVEQDMSVWLRVFDETGAEVYTFEDFIEAAEGWRYIADTNAAFESWPAGWTLQISWGSYSDTPITTAMSIDTLSFSRNAGYNLDEWFSGGTIPFDSYGFRFADGTPLSRSERVLADSSALLFSTEPILTGGSGLVTFGVALRSLVNETATATISVYDTATSEELATAQFDYGVSWGDYSFTFQSTGDITIGITATPETGVDNLILETGVIPMPFFHGGTPWEEAAKGYIVKPSKMTTPQYRVVWMGEPFNSPSRLEWLGIMSVGGPFGTEGSPAGICDAFAFIYVLQGEVRGVAAFGLRLPIPPDVQVRPLERTMHEVTCIEGPKVIEEVPTGDTGGAMRIVDFTLVAGRPFAYSATEILQYPTRMSDLNTTPWPGTDSCEVETITPIVDPDCVIPPAPPRVPTIPATCVVTEPSVQRYWVEVPAASVSLWKQTMTRIIIQSGEQAIRQVRVRAFPNPFGRTNNTYGRENIVLNPRAISTGEAWLPTPGTTGVAPLTYPTAVAFPVSAAVPTGITTAAMMKWTTAATAGVVALETRVEATRVVAGATYDVRIWAGFKRAVAPVAGANIRGRIVWYNEAAAIIGTSYGTTVNVNAANWMKESTLSNIVAPGGAFFARVGVEYVSGDTVRPSINDELWATAGFMQKVPSNREVVIRKGDDGNQIAPTFEIDMNALPVGAVLTNAAIETDLNSNTVMQFTSGPGSNAVFSFTTPAVLEPGKSYALQLDGAFPQGATELATVTINNTTTRAYDPFDPFVDPTGGVKTQGAGQETNTYTVTFISAGPEITNVLGFKVFEVDFSNAYFDGTMPDAGGGYMSWLGTTNDSVSLALTGLAVDPCSWCSEFVISYLPPQTELTVDSILERAFANVKGQGEQSADTLLYASDGGPMTWTSLTCGIPYLISIDVPDVLLPDVTISVETAKAG